MIAYLPTAFTDRLYEHNLIGVAVGVAAAAVVGILYLLTNRGICSRSVVATTVLTGVIAAAGAAGFFIMAADTFLSAASGVVSVAALLVLADVLLRRRNDMGEL